MDAGFQARDTLEKIVGLIVQPIHAF